MLKCGMSEVNITPWLGLNIPGYLHLRSASGIKDELYAKAIVFTNDNHVTGLVAIDALDLERDDVLRIRKRVHQFTGIPGDNIMVCLTHTHTGGPVVNSFVTERDEEYISYLVNKAADAIILAYNKMQPVKTGTDKGFVDDISFNRRYFMKDGSVKTNPGKLNPLIDKPAGPIDPDVMIIKIEDFESKTIGAVINFACHLDVTGGNHYSADYAGELARVLKSVYGKDFISLFLNGLSGNINHFNTKTSQPSPLHYKKMGKILAGEVIKILPKIQCEENVDIGSKTEILNLPLRTVQEEELQKARQTINSQSSSETDKLFAQEVLEFAKNKNVSVDVEVQVLKIGNTVITGYPGDVFVEFGLQIKQESPYIYNLIASHTNGRNGYIPTKEAFLQGGYEVRTTRSNKLAHDAGERITDTVLRIMNTPY